MSCQITYIYHDCFLLETEKAVFLFDYWKDPLADGNIDFPPLLKSIPPDKPFYVLVSHHHKDHFSRRIFLWYNLFPLIKYIVSNDTFKAVKYMFKEGTTYAGPRPSLASLVVLKEGESFEDELVKIDAFGSTDIGNSYVVSTQGKVFFHAGDLNAWIWKDESTETEVEAAMQSFITKLERVKSHYSRFDVAMFPVDSRLGTDYFEGASIFVRMFDVDYFIPMHFELVENPEDKTQRRLDAARFHLYANAERGSYLFLSATRDSFLWH